MAVWHVQIIFQNYVNWPRSNSQHFSNFMGTDTTIFKDTFLHPIHTCICFACQWTSWVLSVFNRGYFTFELRKSLKNLCYTQYLCCTNSDVTIRNDFILNISFVTAVRSIHAQHFLFWNHVLYCLVLTIYSKYLLQFFHNHKVPEHWILWCYVEMSLI